MPTLEHGHLRGCEGTLGRFGRQGASSMTVARERLKHADGTALCIFLGSQAVANIQVLPGLCLGQVGKQPLGGIDASSNRIGGHRMRRTFD